MRILTRQHDARDELSDMMSRLRADPWQSILTATSTAVIIGVALFLSRDLSALAVGVLAGFAIVVSLRIRFPELALAIQLALLLVAAGFDERLVSPGLAMAFICLISLGIERSLRVVVPAVLLVQVAFYTTLALLNEGPFNDIDDIDETSVFGIVCGTAGIAALGVAIRSQRQYIEAISQRAIHAEESREAEARQKVSEERLRIARDLHDSVAHHISVISVYTGLARTSLSTTDTRAESALASAQEAARSVLAELQHIVHILRDPEHDGVNPRQPAPDFRSIEDLVLSFEETGLDVDFHTHGCPESISTATGLVAYRIVQEALTNAHKHGDGQATVEIACADPSITILVTNAVGNSNDSAGRRRGTGHGLIGMKERVRMIDGSLVHTLENGTFTLRAELPWRAHGSETETTFVGDSQND